MPRHRTGILWLAAVFVVASSAFAVAQVRDVPTDPPPRGPKVIPAPTLPSLDEPDEVATPEPEPAGTDVSTDREARGPAGERRSNHGFYVSKAARCEDVDDPETTESPDFSAPEDCSGAGHGEYVSSVAKSSVGKKKN